MVFQALIHTTVEDFWPSDNFRLHVKWDSELVEHIQELNRSRHDFAALVFSTLSTTTGMLLCVDRTTESHLY
jgi:hypothetical protein